MNIYDTHVEKDGIKIKKVYLNYVDSKKDNRRKCDCCDAPKPLASIFPLFGDAMCICKDCLLSMASQFEIEEDNEVKIPSDAHSLEVFHIKDKEAFVGFKISNDNFCFTQVPYTGKDNNK